MRLLIFINVNLEISEICNGRRNNSERVRSDFFDDSYIEEFGVMSDLLVFHFHF